MAQAIAVAPFAPKLVQLVEARIRVEDMNAQRAAATITDVTKEIARLTATPPRVNREQAVARRDRRRSAADDHDRVVHLLQRLRPALHVVDGDALREGGRGPQELRGAAARQGRGREPPGCRHAGRQRADRPGAAAEVRRRARPERDHRAAAGRDARHRGAIQRQWRGRARWRRARRIERTAARRGVLHELAGGAQVARLRQALAQRAGRLPLHPPDGRDADRARQSEARSRIRRASRTPPAFRARRAGAKA